MSRLLVVAALGMGLTLTACDAMRHYTSMDRASGSSTSASTQRAAMPSGATTPTNRAMMPARMATVGGSTALTDERGMTLYTFERDTAGKSVCTGQCAQNWPPLKAGADAMTMGDWTIVLREDGTRQWAYRGKPLYTYAKDQKAGDATGDNVGTVWRIARP